mmetsp:Transcript_80497/g.232633  ORF Transcript_80497/g.232633 Transcript_80497/m.232633 type:complete len:210 (+) Transcript_80497:52-681(+)
MLKHKLLHQARKLAQLPMRGRPRYIKAGRTSAVRAKVEGLNFRRQACTSCSFGPRNSVNKPSALPATAGQLTPSFPRTSPYTPAKLMLSQRQDEECEYAHCRSPSAKRCSRCQVGMALPQQDQVDRPLPQHGSCAGKALTHFVPQKEKRFKTLRSSGDGSWDPRTSSSGVILVMGFGTRQSGLRDVPPCMSVLELAEPVHAGPSAGCCG